MPKSSIRFLHSSSITASILPTAADGRCELGNHRTAQRLIMQRVTHRPPHLFYFDAAARATVT